MGLVNNIWDTVVKVTQPVWKPVIQTVTPIARPVIQTITRPPIQTIQTITRPIWQPVIRTMSRPIQLPRPTFLPPRIQAPVVRLPTIQQTFNRGSQLFQRSPLAAVNTMGQYAGNVLRAQRLPTIRQGLNAGAGVLRQTPLRSVVNAGQQFQRQGGVQTLFNQGSRALQRSPLAAVNTLGQYAGNALRSGRLPTVQQGLNAGATVLRQTPLAGAVNLGAQARQNIVRAGGVQGVVNRGSQLFQRSPLAAVNTMGQYAGSALRSGRLPTVQQGLNAGATVFRQTPLAGVVNAGAQARQNLVRAGGVQQAINNGSRFIQSTPLAAVNTLGQYAGNALRSGRLPTVQQGLNAGATLSRQMGLGAAVDAGQAVRRSGLGGLNPIPAASAAGFYQFNRGLSMDPVTDRTRNPAPGQADPALANVNRGTDFFGGVADAIRRDPVGTVVKAGLLVNPVTAIPTLAVSGVNRFLTSRPTGTAAAPKDGARFDPLAAQETDMSSAEIRARTRAQAQADYDAAGGLAGYIGKTVGSAAGAILNPLQYRGPDLSKAGSRWLGDNRSAAQKGRDAARDRLVAAGAPAGVVDENRQLEAVAKQSKANADQYARELASAGYIKDGQFQLNRDDPNAAGYYAQYQGLIAQANADADALNASSSTIKGYNADTKAAQEAYEQAEARAGSDDRHHGWFFEMIPMTRRERVIAREAEDAVKAVTPEWRLTPEQRSGGWGTVPVRFAHGMYSEARERPAEIFSNVVGTGLTMGLGGVPTAVARGIGGPIAARVLPAAASTGRVAQAARFIGSKAGTIGKVGLGLGMGYGIGSKIWTGEDQSAGGYAERVGRVMTSDGVPILGAVGYAKFAPRALRAAGPFTAARPGTIAARQAEEAVAKAAATAGKPSMLDRFIGRTPKPAAQTPAGAAIRRDLAGAAAPDAAGVPGTLPALRPGAAAPPAAAPRYTLPTGERPAFGRVPMTTVGADGRRIVPISDTQIRAAGEFNLASRRAVLSQSNPAALAQEEQAFLQTLGKTNTISIPHTPTGRYVSDEALHQLSKSVALAREAGFEVEGTIVLRNNALEVGVRQPAGVPARPVAEPVVAPVEARPAPRPAAEVPAPASAGGARAGRSRAMFDVFAGSSPRTRAGSTAYRTPRQSDLAGAITTDAPSTRLGNAVRYNKEAIARETEYLAQYEQTLAKLEGKRGVPAGRVEQARTNIASTKAKIAKLEDDLRQYSRRYDRAVRLEQDPVYNQRVREGNYDQFVHDRRTQWPGGGHSYDRVIARVPRPGVTVAEPSAPWEVLSKNYRNDLHGRVRARGGSPETGKWTNYDDDRVGFSFEEDKMNSGWDHFTINRGAASRVPGSDTEKGFVTLDDWRQVNDVDMIDDIVLSLRDAGFNGNVKFARPERAHDAYDNIVLHGADAAERERGLVVVQDVLRRRSVSVDGVSRGVDPAKGGSFNQMRARTLETFIEKGGRSPAATRARTTPVAAGRARSSARAGAGAPAGRAGTLEQQYARAFDDYANVGNVATNARAYVRKRVLEPDRFKVTNARQNAVLNEFFREEGIRPEALSADDVAGVTTRFGAWARAREASLLEQMRGADRDLYALRGGRGEVAPDLVALEPDGTLPVTDDLVRAGRHELEMRRVVNKGDAFHADTAAADGQVSSLLGDFYESPATVAHAGVPEPGHAANAITGAQYRNIARRVAQAMESGLEVTGPVRVRLAEDGYTFGVRPGTGTPAAPKAGPDFIGTTPRTRGTGARARAVFGDNLFGARAKPAAAAAADAAPVPAAADAPKAAKPKPDFVGKPPKPKETPEQRIARQSRTLDGYDEAIAAEMDRIDAQYGGAREHVAAREVYENRHDLLGTARGVEVPVGPDTTPVAVWRQQWLDRRAALAEIRARVQRGERVDGQEIARLDPANLRVRADAGNVADNALLRHPDLARPGPQFMPPAARKPGTIEAGTASKGQIRSYIASLEARLVKLDSTKTLLTKAITKGETYVRDPVTKQSYRVDDPKAWQPVVDRLDAEVAATVTEITAMTELRGPAGAKGARGVSAEQWTAARAARRSAQEGLAVDPAAVAAERDAEYAINQNLRNEVARLRSARQQTVQQANPAVARIDREIADLRRARVRIVREGTAALEADVARIDRAHRALMTKREQADLAGRPSVVARLDKEIAEQARLWREARARTPASEVARLDTEIERLTAERYEASMTVDDARLREIEAAIRTQNRAHDAARRRGDTAGVARIEGEIRNLSLQRQREAATLDAARTDPLYGQIERLQNEIGVSDARLQQIDGLAATAKKGGVISPYEMVEPRTGSGSAARRADAFLKRVLGDDAAGRLREMPPERQSYGSGRVTQEDRAVQNALRAERELLEGTGARADLAATERSLRATRATLTAERARLERNRSRPRSDPEAIDAEIARIDGEVARIDGDLALTADARSAAGAGLGLKERRAALEALRAEVLATGEVPGAVPTQARVRGTIDGKTYGGRSGMREIDVAETKMTPGEFVAEIDRDLAAVNAEIARSEARVGEYSGFARDRAARADADRAAGGHLARIEAQIRSLDARRGTLEVDLAQARREGLADEVARIEGEIASIGAERAALGQGGLVTDIASWERPLRLRENQLRSEAARLQRHRAGASATNRARIDARLAELEGELRQVRDARAGPDAYRGAEPGRDRAQVWGEREAAYAAEVDRVRGSRPGRPTPSKPGKPTPHQEVMQKGDAGTLKAADEPAWDAYHDTYEVEDVFYKFDANTNQIIATRHRYVATLKDGKLVADPALTGTADLGSYTMDAPAFRRAMGLSRDTPVTDVEFGFRDAVRRRERVAPAERGGTPTRKGTPGETIFNPDGIFAKTVDAATGPRVTGRTKAEAIRKRRHEQALKEYGGAEAAPTGESYLVRAQQPIPYRSPEQVRADRITSTTFGKGSEMEALFADANRVPVTQDAVRGSAPLPDDVTEQVIRSIQSGERLERQQITGRGPAFESDVVRTTGFESRVAVERDRGRLGRVTQEETVFDAPEGAAGAAGPTSRRTEAVANVETAFEEQLFGTRGTGGGGGTGGSGGTGGTGGGRAPKTGKGRRDLWKSRDADEAGATDPGAGAGADAPGSRQQQKQKAKPKQETKKRDAVDFLASISEKAEAIMARQGAAVAKSEQKTVTTARPAQAAPAAPGLDEASRTALDTLTARTVETRANAAARNERLAKLIGTPAKPAEKRVRPPGSNRGYKPLWAQKTSLSREEAGKARAKEIDAARAKEAEDRVKEGKPAAVERDVAIPTASLANQGQVARGAGAYGAQGIYVSTNAMGVPTLRVGRRATSASATDYEEEDLLQGPFSIRKFGRKVSPVDDLIGENARTKYGETGFISPSGRRAGSRSGSRTGSESDRRVGQMPWSRIAPAVTPFTALAPASIIDQARDQSITPVTVVAPASALTPRSEIATIVTPAVGQGSAQASSQIITPAQIINPIQDQTSTQLQGQGSGQPGPTGWQEQTPITDTPVTPIETPVPPVPPVAPPIGGGLGFPIPDGGGGGGGGGAGGGYYSFEEMAAVKTPAQIVSDLIGYRTRKYRTEEADGPLSYEDLEAAEQEARKAKGKRRAATMATFLGGAAPAAEEAAPPLAKRQTTKRTTMLPQTTKTPALFAVRRTGATKTPAMFQIGGTKKKAQPLAKVQTLGDDGQYRYVQTPYGVVPLPLRANPADRAAVRSARRINDFIGGPGERTSKHRFGEFGDTGREYAVTSKDRHYQEDPEMSARASAVHDLVGRDSDGVDRDRYFGFARNGTQLGRLDRLMGVSTRRTTTDTFGEFGDTGREYTVVSNDPLANPMAKAQTRAARRIPAMFQIGRARTNPAVGADAFVGSKRPAPTAKLHQAGIALVHPGITPKGLVHAQHLSMHDWFGGGRARRRRDEENERFRASGLALPGPTRARQSADAMRDRFMGSGAKTGRARAAAAQLAAGWPPVTASTDGRATASAMTDRFMGASVPTGKPSKAIPAALAPVAAPGRAKSRAAAMAARFLGR